MDSACSTKVSQLFTKGSHHRNISLVSFSQNFCHQDPSSRDISLNSKYIVVFKNPRNKTNFYLDRQVYAENISSFHKTYLDVCKGSHSYPFVDFTHSINSLLRFRTKIIPEENTTLVVRVAVQQTQSPNPVTSHVNKPNLELPLMTSQQTNLTFPSLPLPLGDKHCLPDSIAPGLNLTLICYYLHT